MQISGQQLGRPWRFVAAALLAVPVLAFANPVAALVITLILLGLAIWALWAGYRAFRRMFTKPPQFPSRTVEPPE